MYMGYTTLKVFTPFTVIIDHTYSLYTGHTHSYLFLCILYHVFLVDVTLGDIVLDPEGVVSNLHR